MNLFWLSFCDPSRPEGQQFLGACVVHGGETGDPAYDMQVAVQAAWALGLNPGGEVLGRAFPPGLEKSTHPKWIGMMLTRQDCEEFDREMICHAPN